MTYRLNNKKHNGYTLIEIIVVIAIMGSMTTLFLVNYHSTNKRSDLIMTAQKVVADIRSMQNNSLGGAIYGNGRPAGGWGAYFTMSSSTEYILFADISGDHEYQSNERVMTIPLPKGIRLLNIEGAGGNTSIVFMPPDPDTYIIGTAHPVSADNRHNSTYMIFADDNNTTKKVSVNFFGLIYVE